VYVNHERSMALKAFSYDDHGKLTEINEALAVPDSWMSQVPENGRAEQQDLKLSADGRFLYSVYRAGEDILASNGERSYVPGFEGVAVFSVDQRNGKVTAVQRLELDCEWARGCAISPNGKWLVVGALFSDELITLAIGADGRLTDTGIRTPQPSAAGVTFFKPGSASDDGVSGGFF
jgi:6-phosphogluconolactonase (cycloisomerase 2 family)